MALYYTKEFQASLLTLPEVSRQLEDLLREEKCTQKDIHNATLLLEETIAVLTNENTDLSVDIILEKRASALFVSVVQKGEENNPLDLLQNYNPDDDVERIRHTLFSAFRYKLRYVYRKGCNKVSIRINQAENHLTRDSILCLLGGVVTGALIQFFLPSEIAAFLLEYFFDAEITMFSNALKMMLAPLVFTSIVISLSASSGTFSFGKIAGKAIRLFVISSSFAIFLGICWGFVVFSQGILLHVPFAVESSETVSPLLMVKNMVMGIIPENLVSPILNNNMLQVIFVAVVMGICFSHLSDQVKPFLDLIEVGNHICMEVMQLITKFIPLSCFCAMASTVLSVGFSAIASLIQIIIVLSVGYCIFIILYALFLGVTAKINPVLYLRKTLPYLLIPFSIKSSSASVPMTVAHCTDKLGVDKRLVSFTATLGSTLNMNGLCLSYGIFTLYMMFAYDLPITVPKMIMLMFMAVIMGMATPGVSGSGLISYASIFAAVGIPLEPIIPLLLGFMQLEDPIDTAVNVYGDICSTVYIGAKEHMLNYEVFGKL